MRTRGRRRRPARLSRRERLFRTGLILAAVLWIVVQVAQWWDALDVVDRLGLSMIVLAIGSTVLGVGFTLREHGEEQRRYADRYGA